MRRIKSRGGGKRQVLKDDLWQFALAEDFLGVNDLDTNERLVRSDIQRDFLVKSEGAALVLALNQADVQGINLGSYVIFIFVLSQK